MLKFETGTVLLERYRLEQELGTGGTGTVYLAEDSQLNRKVAIKLLHQWSQDSASEPALRRFEREAQSLSKLDHPNIIRLFRYGELQEGMPFLVMEFAEGKSLKELITQRQCLPCNEAVELGMQICSALEYAHSLGIVHRDLKPENIVLVPVDIDEYVSGLSTSQQESPQSPQLMRNEDLSAQQKSADSSSSQKMRVKILDFGLCKQTDDGARTITETGLIVGSVLYMSPEQGLGEKIDERSDVYSFGCVMFEMITGEPPFTGETSAAVLLQHMSATAPKILKLAPKSGLPKSLEQLIEKSIAKNKNDRYKNFSELKVDLGEIALLNNSGVFIKDSAQAKSSVSHKQRLLILASAFLFILLSAVLFLFFTDKGNLLIAEQIQATADAPSSIKSLVWMHKKMLSGNKVEPARKLVEDTCAATTMFQLWPSSLRARFMTAYIENYEAAGLESDAFDLSLNFLSKCLASLRREQMNQQIPPDEEMRLLAKICRQLYGREHSRREWKAISELMELNASIFIKQNPGHLLWPSTLRAAAWSKANDLNSESSIELLSKMYVQASEIAQASGEAELVKRTTDLAIALDRKHGLYFDEHMQYSTLCKYYISQRDIMKAREALAEIERTIRQHGLLLSNAETDSVNRLRVACGMGKPIPLPAHTGKTGFFTEMLMRSEKEIRKQREQK